MNSLEKLLFNNTGAAHKGSREIVQYTKGNGNKTAVNSLLPKDRELIHTVILPKDRAQWEKKIDVLFKEATENNWILFFDEADALFKKRTDVKDSHDRYSNIEINYLLQRIAGYEGKVIIGVCKDCK